MEDTLFKALERTPDLLAIIVIVYLMFKFLEKMDERMAQRNDEFLTTIKEIHSENMEARNQARQVIERNTNEAANASNALREMLTALRDLLNRRAH